MKGMWRIRNMNKHGLKRNEVGTIKEKQNLNKHRNDHRANRRQKEPWESLCSALSIFHSFAGYHPLSKLFMIDYDAFMETPHQKHIKPWWEWQPVPNTRLCFSILNPWATVRKKTHFPSKTKFAYMHCLMPPPSDCIYDVRSESMGTVNAFF